MSSPLEDLKTRIDELKSDFEFASIASQLRPRLADTIQWQGPPEIVELCRRFIGSKRARAEGIFGPLLIRLMAIFERYLRLLVFESVEARVSRAKKFDDLPAKLVSRNLILTGRVLANSESPRDYLNFNIDALILNLATCRPGVTQFSLNPDVFSATVIGVNSIAIDKALENLDITEYWDFIGNDVKLATLLGTDGARATSSRTVERLKELSRWRNNLAHGSDEIVISETQLREAIEFVALFSTALDGAVKRRLKQIDKSR